MMKKYPQSSSISCRLVIIVIALISVVAATTMDNVISSKTLSRQLLRGGGGGGDNINAIDKNGNVDFDVLRRKLSPGLDPRSRDNDPRPGLDTRSRDNDPRLQPRQTLAPTASPSESPSASPSEAAKVVPFVCGETYSEDGLVVEVNDDIDCTGSGPTKFTGKDQTLQCDDGAFIIDVSNNTSAETIILAGGTTMVDCVIVSEAQNVVLIDNSLAANGGGNANFNIVRSFISGQGRGEAQALRGLVIDPLDDTRVTVSIEESDIINNKLAGVRLRASLSIVKVDLNDVKVKDNGQGFDVFVRSDTDFAFENVVVTGGSGTGVGLFQEGFLGSEIVVSKLKDSVFCFNGGSDIFNEFDLIGQVENVACDTSNGSQAIQCTQDCSDII